MSSSEQLLEEESGLKALLIVYSATLPISEHIFSISDSYDMEKNSYLLQVT